MTGFDLYVLIVCFAAFFSTLGVLSALLYIIVRQDVKLIECGASDDKIIIEYLKRVDKREHPRSSATTRIVAGIACAVVVAVFAITCILRFSDPLVKGPMPVPRVVASDSMSYQRESNDYLKENDLNDQFDTFDLIFTRELPGEFELELYDVVVYEYRGDLIVHRIIGIEEPNEKHPEHRLFELRGDAVKYSDYDPVAYSQMKAIYEGDRIPFVGSFVLFLQSPPGWLCILLIVVGFVVAPMLEKYMQKKRKTRLEILGFFY